MEWLADDILLLAVRGDGRLCRSSMLPDGVACAELVILAARGRLDIERHRIIVTDSGPTGDPLLDGALVSMSGSTRPPTVHAWVTRNPRNRKRLVDSYLQRLAAAGTIAARRHRVLGKFPVTRWDVISPARRDQARARLDAIATGTSEIGLEQAALAGLIEAMDLDRSYYRRAERKRIKAAARSPQNSATAAGAAASAAIRAARGTLRRVKAARYSAGS